MVLYVFIGFYMFCRVFVGFYVFFCFFLRVVLRFLVGF